MNNINERLAVEVMGWQTRNNPVHCGLYLDEFGIRQCTIKDWRPDTDMNQVMKCVLEAKNKHKLAFNFWISETLNSIRIFDMDKQIECVWKDKIPDDKLAFTICEAILETT